MPRYHQLSVCKLSRATLARADHCQLLSFSISMSRHPALPHEIVQARWRRMCRFRASRPGRMCINSSSDQVSRYSKQLIRQVAVVGDPCGCVAFLPRSSYVRVTCPALPLPVFALLLVLLEFLESAAAHFCPPQSTFYMFSFCPCLARLCSLHVSESQRARWEW